MGGKLLKLNMSLPHAQNKAHVIIKGIQTASVFLKTSSLCSVFLRAMASFLCSIDYLICWENDQI